MTLEPEPLLDLAGGDAPEGLEVAPPPARMGPGQLAWDVLRRPSAAFARLAEHPNRRWLLPVLAFVALSTALALAQALSPRTIALAQAQMSAQMARSGAEMTPEQMQQVQEFQSSGAMRTFAVVGALIGGLLGSILGLLIVAALFHFLGAVMGGQQSFSQVFTVVAWATLPMLLGLALKLVATLLGNVDPTPGLSGLVGDPLGGQPSPWGPLLAPLELWHLWTLALYVLALQAVARISRRRALVAVGGLLLLQVALGLAGVFIQGALAGLGGG